MTDEPPLTILTVHGTGDTAEGPDGAKWYQRGSEFAAALQAGLGARGLASEIVPFLWSGKNSASARERASRSLAGLIRSLRRRGRVVHIVAHSHGGNVAVDAACMLGWNMSKRRPQLASLATVGAPFLHTKVSWAERAGAWVFLALVLLGLVASIAYGLIMAYWAPRSLEGDYWAAFLIPAGLFLASLAAAPIAIGGARRIARVVHAHRTNTEVLAIWHPADEAIAFLRQLERVRVSAFPPGALLRSSRSSAVIWGVRASLAAPPAIVLVILAWPLIFAATRYLQALGWLPHLDFVEYIGPSADDNYPLDPVSFSIFLGSFASAVFIGVYAGYRLIAGVLAEFFLRGRLNRMVGSALKGMALGRDNESRIGDVDVKTRYFNTRESVVAGEAAERMLARSADATARLFDKYRTSVFRIGGDAGATIQELSQDALTWDSLVHTTYFDQPEIAETLAAYVAETQHGRLNAKRFTKP
jgi:hypothetical protein